MDSCTCRSLHAGCARPGHIWRNPVAALGLRQCLPPGRVALHSPLHGTAPGPEQRPGRRPGIYPGNSSAHQSGLHPGLSRGISTTCGTDTDAATEAEASQGGARGPGESFDWGDRPSVMYRCTIAYDGTHYSGFQLQNGRTDAPTVQWKLERAIREITHQPREVPFSCKCWL